MEKLKMIRGSKDRAEEVKKVLKEWGAMDTEDWMITDEDAFFYVMDNKVNVIFKEDELFPYINFEIVELPEKPKKKEKHQFKPFDRVLVRDSNKDNWKCGIFSHSSNGNFNYVCVGASWKQCIPFEGNEELLGTTNEPKGGEE